MPGKGLATEHNSYLKKSWEKGFFRKCQCDNSPLRFPRKEKSQMHLSSIGVKSELTPHFWHQFLGQYYNLSLWKTLKETVSPPSQHSRLWHTSTVAYSPEAMLMISLTIASWASSYSSLFFIYSSLMVLSLLWTKQEYLEAVMFCLHLQCQTFGLLIRVYTKCPQQF